MKQQFRTSQFTLKKSEILKIIGYTINFRDRCIIKSLYWGGMRREEVTNLQILGIDFERKRFRVIGKFGKERVVPFLNDEFVNDLKHLIGSKKDGYVFVGPTNKKLSCRMINKITATAGRKANIKNPYPNEKRKEINPHLFRHSIARHLKDDGYSAEFVQNFLGHASYKTTMDIYGTMGIDDMEKMIKDKQG